MPKAQTPVAWALLPLKRYAQFSGRSTRAEFWWFTLAYMVAGLAVDAIDLAFGSEIGILGMIFTFGLALPSISVTVRRLHDIGLSGWWLLAVVAPAAVFGFQTTGASLDSIFNGLEPSGSSLVWIIAFVITCFVLMICMALPGIRGSNHHGSDPYGGNGANALA